jgi:hypothetical protein
MSLDYFISIEKVAEESNNSIEGIKNLCIKHGLGVRDYDKEINIIDENGDIDKKKMVFKGMMASEYIALFGSL